MHLYIRVCMKDLGSLIWFVFQRSTQKKTCDIPAIVTPAVVPIVAQIVCQ